MCIARTIMWVRELSEQLMHIGQSLSYFVTSPCGEDKGTSIFVTVFRCPREMCPNVGNSSYFGEARVIS